LIFCSDWKFAALVYGINAACADYFCLWCKLRKMDRGKLVVSAEHRHVADWRNGPSDGMVQEPLLDAIDFVDIFIDLLHLFLRVVDVLLACLFTEILKTVGGGRSFSKMPRFPGLIIFPHGITKVQLDKKGKFQGKEYRSIMKVRPSPFSPSLYFSHFIFSKTASRCLLLGVHF